MELYTRIIDDLKQAMKARDAEKLGVLRQLKAAMQNESIEKGVEQLEDSDMITLLKREVKRRKESIVEYEKADRADLAEGEKKEVTYLEVYLPAQMTEEEVEAHVTNVLKDMGDVGPQDFGKVMSSVMADIGQNVDGSLVSKVLKKLLS